MHSSISQYGLYEYVLIEYWAAKNFAIDKNETQNSVMILFVSKKLRLIHWNFYEAFMGKWFNTKRFYEYLEKKVVSHSTALTYV